MSSPRTKEAPPATDADMGQILQDHVYQYTALSRILDGLHHWKGQGTPPFIYALTSQLVRTIYAESPPDVELYCIIVDAVVRFGNAQDFEHFASDEGYPGKFVRDVMAALGKAKEQKGVVHEEMMVPPPPPFVKEAVLSPLWDAQVEMAERETRGILKGIMRERKGKNVRFVG
jgi:hypothetical protein